MFYLANDVVQTTEVFTACSKSRSLHNRAAEQNITPSSLHMSPNPTTTRRLVKVESSKPPSLADLLTKDNKMFQ